MNCNDKKERRGGKRWGGGKGRDESVTLLNEKERNSKARGKS